MFLAHTKPVLAIIYVIEFIFLKIARKLINAGVELAFKILLLAFKKKPILLLLEI